MIEKKEKINERLKKDGGLKKNEGSKKDDGLKKDKEGNKKLGLGKDEKAKKSIEKEVNKELLEYEENIENQMDEIVNIIDEINSSITEMRNKYKNFTKVHSEIHKKNKGIVLYNDGKDFLKELNLQKKLVERELEFFISIRNLLFKQLYQELHSISKSLLNLEVVLYADRINNQEHYKKQKYTELKPNPLVDSNGTDEIYKLLNININSIKEITSQIGNHSNYLQEIFKKENEGYNIRNFYYSLESQSKKLLIELDTNKNQLNNIISEHLMRFICCNAKIQYSLGLSDKCNRDDELNMDKIQNEIDEAINSMSFLNSNDVSSVSNSENGKDKLNINIIEEKNLKMSDTNVACDIEAKLDNKDLDRKKKFNKTLYGDKLKSTYDEVDIETVTT